MGGMDIRGDVRGDVTGVVMPGWDIASRRRIQAVTDQTSTPFLGKPAGIKPKPMPERMVLLTNHPIWDQIPFNWAIVTLYPGQLTRHQYIGVRRPDPKKYNSWRGSFTLKVAEVAD